jgi:SAM-dependent methyltransferase
MPFDVRKTWDACGEAFDRFTTARDSYSDNIERPAIERLIGDVTGARALDLGCGSGPYSVWLAGRGARVTGLDLSEKMISLARARARGRGVELDFAVADITKPLPFAADRFDLVFTSTALHYIDDLGKAFGEMAKVMKPRGLLVASVLHPMSTARFPLAAAPALDEPDSWETRYFGDRARTIETPWLAFGDVSSEGRRIFSYHHTTADYFKALRLAGLTVTDLCEPRPPDSFIEANAARFEEAMRVPVYLIFRATRKA